MIYDFCLSEAKAEECFYKDQRVNILCDLDISFQESTLFSFEYDPNLT